MCLVSILTSYKLLANKSISGTGHYLSPAGVGGGEGGGKGQLIFARTPLGFSVVTENPRGGIAEIFGRIRRGEPLKFAWKMKAWWRDHESHQKLLGGITSLKKHSKRGSAKSHLV